jgi:hypothetical protein
MLQANCFYVGSLVGVSLDLDSATLHKPEFVKVFIGCRDVERIPHMAEGVDGFRVARTRGTTRRTQKIRMQGAERVRSWIATKHGDGSLEYRTRYALQRETPSLPRFRALVVR